MQTRLYPGSEVVEVMSWAELRKVLSVVPPMFWMAMIATAIAGIGFMVTLGLWTYADATERTDKPGLWTLIVILLNIPVGLLIYLLAGRDPNKKSSGRFKKPVITMFALSILAGLWLFITAFQFVF